MSRPVVPYQKSVTLEYVSTVTLNDSGSADVPTHHIFSLTSAYDPDVTSTGHQPLGFDQFSSLYKEYMVKSVDFHVEPVIDNGTANRMFAVWPTSENSLPPNITTALEQPFSRGIVLSGSTNTPVNRTGSLRGSFKMKRLLAADDLKDRSDVWSSTAASPVANYYLVLSSASFRSGETASTHVLIRMRYHLTFRAPVRLGAS